MRFLIQILCLVMISFPVFADYKLGVFGDSLSAGYHLLPKDAFYSQLEKALQNKGYDVRVLHASKSGETTGGGLVRQQELLDQKPDGVILELGVNDAIRGIDLQTTENNLRELIDNFQSQQISVLLVGMKSTPNRTASYRTQFEDMYRRLADEYQLSFYPFFMEGIFTDIVGDRLVSDKVLPDHLHPNPEGVAVMTVGILPVVEEFLRQQGIYPK